MPIFRVEYVVNALGLIATFQLPSQSSDRGGFFKKWANPIDYLPVLRYNSPRLGRAVRVQ